MDRLGFILNKDKIWKDLDEYSRIVSALEGSWAEIFGKLADQFYFSAVRGKILQIETDNPLWAAEIQFYKEMLIQKTNLCMSDKLSKRFIISDIRVKVCPVVKKEDVQEKPKEDVKLALRDQIKRENQEKRRKGWVMCERCNEIYVESGLCVFCRSETMTLSKP